MSATTQSETPAPVAAAAAATADVDTKQAHKQSVQETLQNLLALGVLKSKTEKGGETHSTSGSKCLDFFFFVFPSIQRDELFAKLDDSWAENASLTLKLLFHVGAIRQGKKDKSSIRVGLEWLFLHHPKTLLANLGSVPALTCWKTLLDVLVSIIVGRSVVEEDLKKSKRSRSRRNARNRAKQAAGEVDEKSLPSREEREAKMKLISVQAREARHEKDLSRKQQLQQKLKDPNTKALYDGVVALFAEQLKVDRAAFEKKEQSRVTYCAKWVPSPGGHHDKYTDLASAIAKALFPRPEGISEVKYRQLALDNLRKVYTTPLREAVKIPESKMSAKQWDEIDYERVPSVAMTLYKDIFLKRDAERYNKYLADVAAGDKKVAAGAVFPHEIVRLCKTSDQPDDVSTNMLADGMWQRMLSDLKKGTAGLQGALAVCDVSGSMSCPATSKGDTCMQISIALSLLVSGLSEGPFHNTVVTFHEEPSLVVLPEGKLPERAEAIRRIPWGGSTDFQAVFDIILNKAVESRCPPELMPKTLFVFSDMEFDWADSNEVDHEQIKARYAAAGYEVPYMVYWNLSHASQSVPAVGTEPNAALVSGFSEVLLKIFMGETVTEPGAAEPTPLDVLYKAVSHELFEALKVVD